MEGTTYQSTITDQTYSTVFRKDRENAFEITVKISHL
jgi:hypothetical protein